MPEDPIASGGATIEIMKFIRDEQARFAEKWPEIDLYVSGGVPLTLAFTEVSMSDISKLLPMTLLIIFIIAGIALRAFTAALFTGFIGILAVIGMMGSGKSTIGSLISKKLNVKFYDTDKFIEDEANMKINEIFRVKGEAFFRDLEEKIILKILQTSNSIISLGGGSFINQKIRVEVLTNNLSIWLNWKNSTLINRIKNSKKRPLALNLKYSLNVWIYFKGAGQRVELPFFPVDETYLHMPEWSASFLQDHDRVSAAGGIFGVEGWRRVGVWKSC